VDFIAQHGRYADVTSALNGTEHLHTGDICVAFADNVDPSHSALSELMAAATPRTPRSSPDRSTLKPQAATE
jgi:hypothetical protein